MRNRENHQMTDAEQRYADASEALHQYVESVADGTRKYDRPTFDRLLANVEAIAVTIVMSKAIDATTFEDR